VFRASSFPSSGATTTAVAASGLQLKRGDSSAVGRGRSGLTTINSTVTIPRSNRKPEAATAVYNLLMMGMRIFETC
jgi:hypothetical protein